MKTKNKIKSKLKQFRSLSRRLKVAITSGFMLLVIVLVYFLPYLSAKSFAISKIQTGSEIVGSSEYNLANLNRFLAPEFLVFTKDNSAEQVTYIKLKRVNLIFWEVADFKIQAGSITELEKSITENKLTPDQFGNAIDLNALENNSTKPDYAPGSVETEIQTLSGDKIQVILGENQQDNTLNFNGSSIGISNVYGVGLSLDEKYLYYSKFKSNTLSDGFINTTADGVIYKLNLQNKQEEKFFEFGEGNSISFRVNDKFVFYATGKNEVGKIDLLTKAVTKLNIATLGVDLSTQTASDIGEYTPLNVLNIDAESGVLEIKLPRAEPKYVKVRLADLAIQ